MAPAATSRATLLLLLLCWAGIFSNCASPSRVVVEPSADFSAYRTWGWKFVAAAESTDVQYQAQIARAVTTHVDRVMTSRGFEFSDREPDLLVQPEVRIRRRHWTIHTAVVDQFLPSLHFTPSYQIEGMTVAEPRTIESARLRIVVVDRARGIIVWSGELRGDSEQSFASRVESSVETVMARFPIAADRPDDMMARPIVAQAGTRPGEGQR